MRRRSRSVSNKPASDSDSTDTCYKHITNTKKMVTNQRYKIKTYALSYIEILDRDACCRLLETLILKHDTMSKYCIEYLSEFSVRFRNMVIQMISNKLLSRSSSNLFEPPSLTLPQNIRDTLRLQAVLNYIISQSSLLVTVDIMNILFTEYPKLLEYHNQHIHTIQPNVLKILGRRK